MNASDDFVRSSSNGLQVEGRLAVGARVAGERVNVGSVDGDRQFLVAERVAGDSPLTDPFVPMSLTFPREPSLLRPRRAVVVPVLGGIVLGAAGLAFLFVHNAAVAGPRVTPSNEQPLAASAKQPLAPRAEQRPTPSAPEFVAAPAVAQARDAPSVPKATVAEVVAVAAIAPPEVRVAAARVTGGASPRRARAVNVVHQAPAVLVASVAVEAPVAALAGPRPPVLSAAALSAEALEAFVRGQFPLARSLYLRATEVSPRSTVAWRGLGLSAARLGQRNDAAHAFERYLQLNPTAADADRIRAKLAKVMGLSPPGT